MFMQLHTRTYSLLSICRKEEGLQLVVVWALILNKISYTTPKAQTKFNSPFSEHLSQHWYEQEESPSSQESFLLAEFSLHSGEQKVKDCCKHGPKVRHLTFSFSICFACGVVLSLTLYLLHLGAHYWTLIPNVLSQVHLFHFDSPEEFFHFLFSIFQSLASGLYSYPPVLSVFLFPLRLLLGQEVQFSE